MVTPTSWWKQWLRKNWDSFEDPILYICSDDLENVINEFSEFSPVSSQDLEVEIPNGLKQANADFYVDYYLMTQCDILGISNSTFSFTAAMLNDKATLFIRPHWDFSTRFTTFDPWNSEPLLYIGAHEGRSHITLREMIGTRSLTQGIKKMLILLLFHEPRNFLKRNGLRLGMAYGVGGFSGIIKSLSGGVPKSS